MIIDGYEENCHQAYIELMNHMGTHNLVSSETISVCHKMMITLMIQYMFKKFITE